METIKENMKPMSTQQLNQQSSQHHPAFRLIQQERIDALDIGLEIYEHIKTGSQHYHLSADNNENVFLVALRTVPKDSTGVAHILEHTVLCGSEKYPVRDPFFMMIRRSLNTFMNAFTSTDWTAYPFASQNKKDFNNLMDVYLDAVFFSRLHPLDFAQEGHRLEFAKADDPNSELQYKGVVYNEMKGAMSSVTSTVWHTMCKYLFPSNTYHFNSGGEPSDIPDLSYEQLKKFYQTHYHPSNAIFMTYGDIPAIEHQQKFEDQVLSRFQKLDLHIAVDDVKRYYAPLKVEEAYALDEEHDEENIEQKKTHLVMGWLLGHTIDLEQRLKAQLLSDLLLSSSAAPLMHALETTDIGLSPSALCGLEDSNKEMSFLCGLEGADLNKARDFEKLVLSVLQEVAEKGVDQQLLDAVLHQLELNQREITGEYYPYGLQLILSGLSTAIHRGDVVQAMNIDRVLAKLSEEIKQQDFVQKLVKSLLLDNPHRVQLVMRPDSALSARRDAAEKCRLQAIKERLDEQQKAEIVELSKQLEQRQQQQDDPNILPKVSIDDIPESIQQPEVQKQQLQHILLHQYAQGTNGLVYQQLIIDLPQMDTELLTLLPVFANCMTELGCDGKNYMQTQLWQSAISGGISAYSRFMADVSNAQQARGIFVLSSRALKRNITAVTDLLYKTLMTLRFDEHDKIRELVAQQRIKKEQSLTANGHQLAMLASKSELSPVALLSHQQDGLASIRSIKALEQQLQTTSGMDRLVTQFEKILHMLQTAPRQFVVVADAEQLDKCQQAIVASWNDKHTTDNYQPCQLEAIHNSVKQAWFVNTQVNFCAKSYPVVPMSHADAPALMVLGAFLRNGLLHRLIREQGGAYGGGASYDSNNACFSFYSYRDPRLTETLNDFDQSIRWLKENPHSEQALEEAILSVVSALDKPSSPAGEAKNAFMNEYFGRSLDLRQQFRKKVTQISIEDLQQLADTYFKPEAASVAVICNAREKDQCQKLGLSENSL